ncbi:phosphoribosyltransferase family protein [Microbacterium sp. NPDC089189]|uniref:ComF family protein n=1 Tax=Microbacterium sp. NPDC089189 TaxID=3154972 RepID=UPI00341E7406
MSPDPLSWWRRASAEALALLVPVDCAGCGTPDTALCDDCRRLLSTPAVLQRRSPSGLRVCAAFSFETHVAAALRELKEGGRTALARPLGAALAACAATQGRDAVFVPVPTSAAAFRRRGYRVPDLLLARAGLPALRGIDAVRRIADQRALGREERAANVALSMRGRTIVAGRRVVIVDDVVTTGATLDEAARALTAAGAEVVAALTVAATPRGNRT